MRRLILIATLVAAFFVSACASTVSPLYTKTDAVTDPVLVGTWVGSDKGDNLTVQIEKMKDASYQVTVSGVKSGDDSVYQAYLVKLGSASYADLLLTNLRLAGQDRALPWGVVALHQVVKYQLSGDDLAVSPISDDALDNSAKQPGFPLQFRATVQHGDTVIILSTTDELRRYLSAHPADIFGEQQHFKRQH
ncbi:MAG TPA: hypothetical protein VKS20_09810 [Candidatus Acidoferrales bacterium]|nr:hypothetical protein [Candidatus Acidoferrales bacterium]